MTLLHSANSLSEVLFDACQRFSKNPALWVKGRLYTYAELSDLAWAIAAEVSVCPPLKRRVAIFSDRNEIAYAGIMGTVLSGMAYVPLNPRFSASRNLDILIQARVGAVVCDRECEAILRSVPDRLPTDLQIIRPDPHNASWISLTAGKTRRAPEVTPKDLSYILFTSGTTGTPKGVPVSHGNVMAYLSTVADLLEPVPSDRFLQLVDLTFDPSVHDLFSCWLAGATLYSVPEGMATMAERFVRDFQITMFTSVPSTVALMKAEGRLAEGSLPSLRHSIFGGQALPAAIASAWQAAAPQSKVRNHYGPTEATIAVSECVWSPELEKAITGTVPIGHAFHGQTLRVVDDSLKPVKPGEVGELLISGSQVTEGYWDNPQATAERYVTLAGSPGAWYRTGDLVLADAVYGLRYSGRADQQLKVRGFRVEGHEVESHVRAVSGSDQVAVIGWPKNEYGLVMGTVAFVVAPQLSEAKIIESCKMRMPDYMVPSRIIAVAELPLNANGKVDYAALSQSKDL